MEKISDQYLRLFIDQAPVSIAMFDRDMRYLAASDYWMSQHWISDRHIVGRSHYEVVPEIPERWKVVHQRGLAGETIREEEDAFERGDGSIQYLRWEVRPWRTADGVIGGIIITTEDVTARVVAERALRESEQRLRLALDAADMGIWEWDLSAGTYQWNDQTYRMLGYEPQSFEPDYNAWARRVHPDDLPRLAAEAQLMMDHPREAFGEYRALGKNDELRWLEARGRFECDGEGRPKRYYGVLMDITERKRAEERDRILTAEVNHRAKNLLAVVQAVALQTTSEDDPKEFAQNFNDRLAGLAASQDLLVQSHWQGVDTAELVRFQLSHFAGLIGQRILVNGPPAQLKASAAQTLGMAIHELATNASKYGALSSPTGTIQVSWGTEDQNPQPRFLMQWVEAHGPTIKEPERPGFGHSILVDMAEYSLEATVTLSYPPTGLVWQLSAPMSEVLAIDE
jgi:PAS domain S-box-containing protein